MKRGERWEKRSRVGKERQDSERKRERGRGGGEVK